MKRRTWHFLATLLGCLGIYILITIFIDGKVVQQRFFPYLPYQLIYAWVLLLIILSAKTVFGKQKNIWFFTLLYGLFLIAILFIRPPYQEHQFTDSPYIWEWGKRVFDHPIIFVNIIGNIILFVPKGIIAKRSLPSPLKYIYVFVLLIILEALQYISKRGIFDITDIILNYIGFLLGMMLLCRKAEL
ncbi:MAG: VanZ family protein [Bacilli bacterium]|jgi:glycopeptide antibiotics resistance protein|nr:VanZ family protein [Bacilli bacterium]HHU24039.1 VanZ family protein [Acholeplasmataceae bacterium]